jgi:hypothetical protein
VVPSSIAPVDGQHVFVLGADEPEELAQVGVNDFTEVKQTVDLTGVDLVGATLDTIGTMMGQYQALAGFDYSDPALVFGFDFNVPNVPSKNKVDGGFAMLDWGDIETEKETYSPNETYCKQIPEGVGSAALTGDNVPQSFPPLLPQWTLQWWMNFRTDLYPSSTGINPEVFNAYQTLVGGLRLRLSGAAGLHEWRFSLEAHGPGLFQSYISGGFGIDAPQGWKLYTLRFDQALAPPNQLEIFVDDALVTGCLGNYPFVPASPPSPWNIVYGDPKLVGQLDDIRFLSRWLSDAEIADSYAGCIANPAPVDFKWVMQIRIDKRLYAERTIASDERRRWTDFLVPVRQLTGPHEVSFRLKLELA